MKRYIAILASTLILPLPPANADAVYRCMNEGRIVFSDQRLTAACTSIDLKVSEPSPEEVARQEEKKRIAAEQEREEQEQAARDRLIQAQIDAAQAAERQAEAQRRLAEQQALDSERQKPPAPYVIWPGYGYPYARPSPIPIRPLYPPPEPARPPSGNQSHSPTGIVGGGSRR